MYLRFLANTDQEIWSCFFFLLATPASERPGFSCSNKGTDFSCSSSGAEMCFCVVGAGRSCCVVETGRSSCAIEAGISCCSTGAGWSWCGKGAGMSCCSTGAGWSCCGIGAGKSCCSTGAGCSCWSAEVGWSCSRCSTISRCRNCFLDRSLQEPRKAIISEKDKTSFYANKRDITNEKLCNLFNASHKVPYSTVRYLLLCHVIFAKIFVATLITQFEDFLYPFNFPASLLERQCLVIFLFVIDSWKITVYVILSKEIFLILLQLTSFSNQTFFR